MAKKKSFRKTKTAQKTKKAKKRPMSSRLRATSEGTAAHEVLAVLAALSRRFDQVEAALTALVRRQREQTGEMYERLAALEGALGNQKPEAKPVPKPGKTPIRFEKNAPANPAQGSIRVGAAYAIHEDEDGNERLVEIPRDKKK